MLLESVCWLANQAQQRLGVARCAYEAQVNTAQENVQGWRGTLMTRPGTQACGTAAPDVAATRASRDRWLIRASAAKLAAIPAGASPADRGVQSMS